MTIDKKRIADEAQHFFEWPDPTRRDTVTLTSCVIFAAKIAEMVNAENIGRGEKLADELRAEIERLRTHAVTLAETARVVEQERCANIVRNAAAHHGLCCSDCDALADLISGLGATHGA